MANAIFRAGSEIYQNYAWTSGNGRAIFRLQEDGNLVLYRDGEAVYQAPNAHPNGFRAIMQDDGNFVLYDANGKALFASGTDSGQGTDQFLAVQDDGNVVVYASEGVPLWSTNTAG